MLLLSFARLKSVSVVVVAGPVVQWPTQRSQHSKEPGAVGWRTRAYHQKLNAMEVLLLAVLDHGDGKGAPGYDGGHGGGNAKASGMAPAAPPSWGPPGFGAAPIMPPGVWPAPGVGFGPPGAAPGGIGDCFAHAVHASAGGGG